MSKRDIQVSLQTQTSGRVPHVGTGAVRGPTWVEQMGEALSYDLFFAVLSRPQLLNRVRSRRVPGRDRRSQQRHH